MHKATAKPDRKMVWIAWEKHRRTSELCRHFDLELEVLQCRGARPLKYLYLSVRTFLLIAARRPEVVVVQNPSVVLTLLACLLRRVLRYALVVDAHNAGIHPEVKILQKLPFLYRFLLKEADLTIVTNTTLADTVRAHGGRPFVMPDKIPRLAPLRCARAAGHPVQAVLICTFAEDEPYRQLLEAAEKFSPQVSFKVTGKESRIPPDLLAAQPANVSFTGFLPEEEYCALLSSADLIIDLTTREDCLVCGAYEALAAEVPMLLSDTAALRAYFYKGAVFAGNTPEELAGGIARAVADLDSLKKDVAEAKAVLEMRWLETAAQFSALLRSL